MEDIFTKFYSVRIQEIHDFLDSESDILYINGFSGSGKSAVLKSALKSYGEDILKFHHLCFKDTVTDDFLLSFYDAFRLYAIKQRISLKKNPESEFLQKVSFYFKNLERRAVVIIDNFEIIPDSSEITDFLLHISGFENVQIIIISKNPTCRLIESPTVRVQNIYFEKINLFEFETVIMSSYPDVSSEAIQELYRLTDGYELYLKMILTYLESMNIHLADFLSELNEKEVPFEEYIIEKQVSLIPNTYYPVLENLAHIHHNVSPAFISSYGLGDVKQLSYLISKFMISEFWGTYYIKSYLRRHFSENVSFQARINIYNKLISIYENELKKSPKDRILRLSRESIRNQIALLEEKIPSAKKAKTTPIFNFAASVNNANWFVTAGNNGAKQGVNLSGKKQQAIIKEQILEKSETIAPVEPSVFETMLLRAEEFENNYEYKEAIETLIEARRHCFSLEEKITAYSKLAQNYLKLNDNNSALSVLRELCEICSSENDIDSFAKYRIEIGKIYKKMYAFSRARACFEEIIEKSNLISKKTLAMAKFALGEIFELDGNSEASLNEFKTSVALILEESGENDSMLPEISYKIASLYDENGYFDEAFTEYENSIHYAETSQNDVYLSKCYTNSGMILADKGDTEQALSYLAFALELAQVSQNNIETYYIARNIAELYRNIEPDKAYDYLLSALEYARQSGNSFEIAISSLELGDFYYDSKQNEQALICYFQAKNALGDATSKENIERVTTRINDMKIKLGDYVFRGMKELYDPD